jgi:hypothetical protein
MASLAIKRKLIDAMHEHWMKTGGEIGHNNFDFENWILVNQRDQSRPARSSDVTAEGGNIGGKQRAKATA